MIELGLSAAGIGALGLSSYILALRAKRKSLGIKVNFGTYKARELEKRGHFPLGNR